MSRADGAGLALRIAGVAFLMVILVALANRYGLGANLTVSSTRWRPLLDRRVIQCLVAGTGGTLRRRSPGAITPSAGTLTDAVASGHRRPS
jgi:hypothetical protein